MARKKLRDAPENTRTRAVRGRRGGLKDLPSMPVDILVEIMSRLHPLDLLHLARTTKDFRRFLMTKSMTYIWKRALANVDGLPPCPEDLSEPVYANLAFDSHCHICLQVGVKVVLWQFRVRYCPACRRIKFLTLTQIARLHPELEAAEIVRVQSLPYMRVKGNCLYHLPDVDQFLSGLGQDTIRMDSSHHRDILEHAKLCETWYEKVKDSRRDELQAIRERRLAEIRARLEKLGWGLELEYLEDSDINDLSTHPQVKQARNLTEKMWENMLPSLLQVMETAKVNRLNFERRIRVFKWLHGFSILYAFWRSSQDVDTPLPQAVDLTYHDEIRTLVESSNADSLDMVLKLRTLEDLLPAWTDEWRRTCDTRLKEKFAPTIAKDATDGEVNFLDLASTVFGCGRCIPGTTAFHYPQVLEHRCLHKALHDYTMEPYTHGDECEFISTRMVARHEKWSCQNLEFTDTHAWAVEVITACGMDPNRATRQEMDALDVRLVCRDCPLSSEDPNIDGRKVMTWRAAIQHYIDHDEGRWLACWFNRDFTDPVCSLDWQRVHEDYMPRVKQLEASATSFYNEKWSSPRYTYKFRCAYCPAGFMDVDHVLGHLSDRHDFGIQDTHDFYRDRCAKPVTTGPVMLILKPRSEIKLRQLCVKGNEDAQDIWEWIEEGRAGFL